MVAIPAKTFLMGTDSAKLRVLLARYRTTHADLFTGEMPRRSVTVAAYEIDRTTVTKSQFRGFVIANPKWVRGALKASAHNGHYLEDWTGTDFPAGEANRPVAFITWPAADAYCGWAGKRLPTEPEWELAALGGLSDPEFSWGDALPDSARANWSGTHIGHTTDVGAYSPNGFGVFDMAGNVWQFMADRWDDEQLSVLTTAQGRRRGTRYTIRGGSFEGGVINLRVRYRDSHPWDGAGKHVGFRCARSRPPLG